VITDRLRATAAGKQQFQTVRGTGYAEVLGCAAFMLILVLLVGGGDDVIAVTTNTSVVTIRDILRLLVFIAPLTVFVLVHISCRSAERKRGTRPSASAEDGATSSLLNNM
jgi:hypothetical protein